MHDSEKNMEVAQFDATADALGYGEANIPLLVDVIGEVNGLEPLYPPKRTAAE